MLSACSAAPQENFGHPKLAVIMAHLQYEFHDYKYTVYRCAAKIITLQKIFYTGNIPHKVLAAVLERHGLRDAEANLMVPPFQLTSLIHDIYFACEKLGHFTKYSSYQLETSTAILANFFWNVYDPTRRHSVSLLEIKVTLLLLCRLVPADQILAEFYKLLCDIKSKCVSRLSFQHLLTTLTKLLTYIGEGTGYGAHNIPLVMQQCFARCHNACGLKDYQFHCLWTTTETRFLIYANLIALIKRLEDTEKLVHNNVCASCHQPKIIGIRFKCQVCTNLSLCLKCFATGYATNKHEAGHRMFEIFTEDLPPKKFSHYFAKLCNFFLFSTGSNAEDTKGFCDANETDTANETELLSIEPQRVAPTVQANAISEVTACSLSKKMVQTDCADIKQKPKLEPSLAGLATTATNASDVSERLQSIIDRLMLQNAKLENQLKTVQTASHEEISAFLSSHQRFLIDIINEMRNFSQTPSTYPSSSTPNRSIYHAQPIIITDSFSSAAVGSNLTHSINGADVNRSYLDANKSDYSLKDLSVWFNGHHKRPPAQPQNALKQITKDEITAVEFNSLQAVVMRDTEMNNFKLLLHKVKEIIDDSYSDNSELAAATQNLENVLDGIIKHEESRRRST